MGLFKLLSRQKQIQEREERRIRYFTLLQDLQEEEQRKVQCGFYSWKQAQALEQYSTCLLERIESERPDALMELAEELEKLLPAFIVWWAREENPSYYQTAQGKVKYIIGLLSRIEVHARHSLSEAVKRIEAAAGANLVEEERIYMWVESGAAFIPPECTRPVALTAEYK